MSNYTKTTNFATKDALSSGDPAKKIKGTEFNTEFDNIATAVATKADLASPALTGTPTAPTASLGTDTTQIATTAFVQAAMAEAGAGTVTSVGVSSSDLTVTNSPVTGSGTIALALNTVGISKGGTGVTSTPSNGQLLVGNGTGYSLATITGGTGISVTNGSGSITLSATGTAGVTTFSAGTTGLTPSTGTTGTVTLGGVLNVANGGTGASTLTSGALLKGAGTGAVTAASAADIVSAIGSTAVTNATNATNVSGTVAIANGGTGATTAANARTALSVPSATGSGASGTWGIAISGNAATVTNGVYTSNSYADPSWITSLAGSKLTNASVTPAKLEQPMTRGTAVSVSSTSTDISTAIPSWARKVSVILSGVSTGGTSNLLIQVGSSTFTTSGYASGSSTGGNTRDTSTAGFLVTGANTSAATNSGAVVLYNITGNTWVSSGSVADTGDGRSGTSGGTVTLSGVLDRVRITTVNGTDTFDAGSVNIIYE
jgi:hypothetical protein